MMKPTVSRLLLGLSLGALFVLLLLPASTYARVGRGLPFDPSELIHAMLFMAVFAFLPPSAILRVRWWHAVLFSLALGLVTEGLQWLVGRGPSLVDVGVDIAGGVLGWRLGLALVPPHMAAQPERTSTS